VLVTFKSLASCFILLALVTASPVFSHPHEFVEMKTKVIFDKSGRVAGLRYDWLFDEIFSAFAVESADSDGDGHPEPENLDKLIVEILGNIAPNSYFTKFEEKSATPKLAIAKPLLAEMQKRELFIRFEVPFETPLELKAKPLIYAIYDGEFYIAMNHSLDNDAVQLVNAPSNCKFEIELPDPSDETKNRARSLDKTQSGGSELGVNFAEWVKISCP